MTAMFEQLSLYLTFPFVQYALIAGVLIALSSSLLGVILVLKRMSLIGDSLSHVAFLAMSVASVLRMVVPTLLVLPMTIAFAVYMMRPHASNTGQNDAKLAMISVASLAIGYLVISVFSLQGNVTADVCTTLFGSTSILTLNSTDVWVCVIMSMIVVFIFIMCYHKIFSITFDEDFCKATGVKTNVYNGVIAVITAVIVVLSMELVGSLLTSALIIFPTLSAMRVCKCYRNVVICAAMLSVSSAFLGIVLSIVLSTPVGSTIVVVQCIFHLIFAVVGKIWR